jgi:hypothetical protein
MPPSSVCSITGCERPPAAELDVRPLCRSHFISTCYELFDEYSRWLEENRFRETNTELVRRFLCQCTQQATEISHNVADLENLERARLLDLLLRATELGKLLRRSPRKVTTIPVRLSSEKLGRSWEEVTRTLVISRHGAAVSCAHPVEVGDQLVVHRLDREASVRARVVWRQARSGEQFEVGVEFVHCDNFWDEDWNSAEPLFLHESQEKPGTHSRPGTPR